MSKIPAGIKRFVVNSVDEDGNDNIPDYFETESDARNKASAYVKDGCQFAVVGRVAAVYEPSFDAKDNTGDFGDAPFLEVTITVTEFPL